MKNDDLQTILIVDDDAKNLQIAMKILKDYKVLFAQSGKKALELLDKNPNIDLILLDVIMPVMNGYETCKEITNNEKYKNIPIIFSTVKDDEKDIIQGFELGAVDYIVKPFYPEVLLKRVQLHLKLSRTTKQLKILNNSLNEKVSEQIEEIRRKDEKILQQEKLKDMNDLVGLISNELKKPISNMKIYLQSMELISESNMNDVFAKSLNKVLSEINGVEEGLSDFSNLFQVDKKIAKHNLKVIIDSVLFKFRSEFDRQKIEIKFIGDNLIVVDMVEEDLKQIFSKLLLVSLNSFSKTTIDNKMINIEIKDDEEKISILYFDNSTYSNFENFKVYLDKNHLLKTKKFDINLYILKMIIEKSNGKLILEENKDGGVLFKVELLKR
ncbi:response regulator [Arcobacter arenosus]|jgi:two-component system sensor histidine kinase/response regulator|uniref:ATP-binding response regulator n=1 Tax=Arcobacter arenosus TaxID=2576037 RepID=UPI003BAAE8F3